MEREQRHTACPGGLIHGYHVTSTTGSGCSFSQDLEQWRHYQLLSILLLEILLTVIPSVDLRLEKGCRLREDPLPTSRCNSYSSYDQYGFIFADHGCNTTPHDLKFGKWSRQLRSDSSKSMLCLPILINCFNHNCIIQLICM